MTHRGRGIRAPTPSGASPPFGDAEVVAQGPHIAQCGWNEALQRGYSLGTLLWEEDRYASDEIAY